MFLYELESLPEQLFFYRLSPKLDNFTAVIINVRNKLERLYQEGLSNLVCVGQKLNLEWSTLKAASLR